MRPPPTKGIEMTELFIKCIIIFAAYFLVKIGLAVIANVLTHYIEKKAAKETITRDPKIYNITTMTA